MNIVSVSTSDRAGGAEKVALDLFQGYRAQGHASRLAVGTKHLADPDIFEIPRRPQPVSATTRLLLRLRRPLVRREGRLPGARRLRGLLENGIHDYPALEDRLGRERFGQCWTRGRVQSIFCTAITCMAIILICANSRNSAAGQNSF